MNMRKISIIPEPQEIILKQGQFVVDNRCKITVACSSKNLKENKFSAELLRDELKKIAGVDIPVKIKRRQVKNNRQAIFLTGRQVDCPWNTMKKASAITGEEEYLLEVTEKWVGIVSQHCRGLFYGVQTLFQLLQRTKTTVTIPGVQIHDYPALAIRGAHFDFRADTLCPNFECLRRAIKTLARYKINTILWEYEDKFPYQKHSRISSTTAFTPEQIADLLALARKYHLQSIPLLQSLGHVGYILQHQEYRHLREYQNNISQFCPLKPGSINLFKDLCSELLSWHQDTAYFHVGGDEAWLLGSCKDCKKIAKKKGVFNLYRDYMHKVFNFLHGQGKTPVIWGDMLVKHSDKIDTFPKNVVIMDWDYNATNPGDVSSVDLFLQHGYDIWTAPAARASSEGTISPNYKQRIPNIIALINKAAESRAKGVLTTSWAFRSVPFESAWYGVICSAEYSWAGNRVKRDEFEGKFARSFFGLSNTKIVEVIYLLSQEYEINFNKPYSPMSRNPHFVQEVIDPSRMRREVQRAWQILQGLKVKKNHLNLRYLFLAAEMKLYEAEEILLFQKVVNYLQRSKKGTTKTSEKEAIIEKLFRLWEQLAMLKRSVTETYGKDNMDIEVGRDVVMRYNKVERKINKYLKLLLGPLGMR